MACSARGELCGIGALLIGVAGAKPVKSVATAAH